MEGVNVVCLPASDAPFGALVQRVLQGLPQNATGADLQRELRVVYPRAVVRPEARLAPLGAARSTRYAYRDPDAVDADDAEWEPGAGLPEGAFDATGIYREANAALADLFGVESADAIIGHDWSEFATPESVEAADQLWGDMAATAIVETASGIASTYHVARRDGTLVEIEYRTVWDPDARLFHTRMRPAQVARG